MLAYLIVAREKKIEPVGRRRRNRRKRRRRMKMPGILKAIGKTKLFRFRICTLCTRACLASYTLCHYHIPDRRGFYDVP